MIQETTSSCNDTPTSGDSWMYPGSKVARHGKSLYKPYIISGYLWVIKVEHNFHTMVVHVRERGTRTNCPLTIEFSESQQKIRVNFDKKFSNTVDGRNPAPPVIYETL